MAIYIKESPYTVSIPMQDCREIKAFIKGYEAATKQFNISIKKDYYIGKALAEEYVSNKVEDYGLLYKLVNDALKDTIWS